jgi:hypothetical protein
MAAEVATPLLMPYATCPECRHLGDYHPRRAETEAECVGGYLGPAAVIGPEGTTVSLSSRCRCERKRIGR